MLRGDNGILNRATEARYSNTISSFDEQTKLASMGVRTSIESNKVSKAGYIATEENNFKELAGEVAKELNVTAIEAPASEGTKINPEGYTVAYYLDKEGSTSQDGEGYIAIWYTDNSLRATMDRTEENLKKYGLTDVASNKSVNQAVLVYVIKVENYKSSLSQKGITSATDGDKYIKLSYFGKDEEGNETSLNNQLGFTSAGTLRFEDSHTKH